MGISAWASGGRREGWATGPSRPLLGGISPLGTVASRRRWLLRSKIMAMRSAVREAERPREEATSVIWLQPLVVALEFLPPLHCAKHGARATRLAKGGRDQKTIRRRRLCFFFDHPWQPRALHRLLLLRSTMAATRAASSAFSAFGPAEKTHCAPESSSSLIIFFDRATALPDATKPNPSRACHALPPSRRQPLHRSFTRRGWWVRVVVAFPCARDRGRWVWLREVVRRREVVS